MVLFVVALFATSSRAGARAPTVDVAIDELLAAAKKDKKYASAAAALTFLKEVQGAKTVETYSSAEPHAHFALQQAEAAIQKSSCAKLDAATLAKATKVLNDSGATLPLPLRAYTTAQQGNDAKALALFTEYANALLPAGECPSEHPDSGSERLRHLNFALQCLQSLAPKQDRTKIEAIQTRAFGCSANNHAVG